MKITSQDLLVLLQKHIEFGGYAQPSNMDGVSGVSGVILDGWFDLEAIAADLNNLPR